MTFLLSTPSKKRHKAMMRQDKRIIAFILLFSFSRFSPKRIEKFEEERKTGQPIIFHLRLLSLLRFPQRLKKEKGVCQQLPQIPPSRSLRGKIFLLLLKDSPRLPGLAQETFHLKRKSSIQFQKGEFSLPKAKTKDLKLPPKTKRSHGECKEQKQGGTSASSPD